MISNATTYPGAHPPVRVLLLDLLPTVPYYSGHLAAALRQENTVQVVLGATTYSRDQTFFRRMKLKPGSGLIDLAYRFRSAMFRRPLKLTEYLINLLLLQMRLLINRPEVIHVQFAPLLEHGLPFEMWFLKTAKALGIKLIYTVHNILPHEHGERFRSAYTSLYGIADHFICHDSVTRERLVREFEVEAPRISVIPHGPLFPDSPNAKDSTREVHRPEHTCTVLWQGIIRPYKGISFLLRAWKAAREAGLDAVLNIVGMGEASELDAIRREVHSLGFEGSVRLDFRFVPVKELSDYYKGADVVVYPYRDITTSGALMTGIGYGKAIIASDLIAFRQLLRHGENALLVPPDDTKGWADALLLLTQDQELRTTLSNRLCWDRECLPTWNAIAKQTARVYNQLLTPATLRGKCSCVSLIQP